MGFCNHCQHGAANHCRAALRGDVKMVFGGIIGVIAVLAAVWVIYDVVVNNKRLSDGMKVLWIVCAVLFSIVTAIVYYFIGRNAKNDLFAR